MINTLSHSAVTQFLECGEKYRLQRVERLRSTKMGSALFFGTSVDKAIEVLLKGGNRDASIQMFMDQWTGQEINGTLEDLHISDKVIYTQGDLDIELLSKDQREELEAAYGFEWQHILDIACATRKAEGIDSVPEGAANLLRHASWLCMVQKGLLMIEEFETEVLPKLRVLDTQKQITLSNGEDSVTGFIDLIAYYDGLSKPVVFDLKTTSVYYKQDSVVTSQQLALYTHAVSEFYSDTRLAGFITLNKRIQKIRTKICKSCGADGSSTKHRSCNKNIDGKRCDGEFTVTTKFKAKSEVIISEMPHSMDESVLDNFDLVNEKIKRGEFERNEASCVGIFGKCAYYSYCHNDQDMTGLIKAPERKK